MNRSRDVLESALSPVWRAAIAEACAQMGVPSDTWERVPPLRGMAEVLALYRRRDELQAQRGWGPERALIAAGVELGVNADSLSRKLRAWLIAVFGR